jgi:dihydroflavonol-4-reductase
MARAFVTGANGHLGCNLVRDLLAHGYEVTAFVREGADLTGLTGLELTLARGDVRDAPSVERAMKGCDLVFHAAAPYVLWAKDPAQIIASTVHGTENVLRAAKLHHVGRIVLTSSSNVVGFTKDPSHPLDETSWNDHMKNPYIRAKNEQERRAWVLAGELGLGLVTVLPTAVLGRFDYKKTPTTAPFVDALAHKGPVPFAMNIVDVRDVARTHVLAAEKAEDGERYLAGGDNVDLHTLAGIIERHTGKRPAEGLPPRWVMSTVAFVSEHTSELSGKAPRITRDVLDDLGGGAPIFDCRKEHEKLYIEPRKAEEVVAETLRWALFMGWLPEKVAAPLRAANPPDGTWIHSPPASAPAWEHDVPPYP